MPSTSWSETLQQQTREAVEGIQIMPDGLLHFKHKTLGYAASGIEDFVRDGIVLRAKKGEEAYTFANANELIAAGWAID